MIRAALLLTGGISLTVVVGVEAAAAISPDSTLDTIQLGLLITAAGMLLVAGKLYGTWQTTQKQLVDKVDQIDGSNIELRDRVSQLEGIVSVIGKEEDASK